MQVAYTAEQESLRRELRAYFAELMTPEVEAEASAGETGGPACLAAVRKMGADGWLGIGWPTEFGGQGRGDVEQMIFFDEAWRVGAPIPFLSINTVGKTIQEYGSDEQKAYFLPRILAGELHTSIGYTEPTAGTDLASLKTTAVKDGDEWVINGQKVFTSLASYADYIWLAARTDPEAPKHKGITIFLVPTDTPGFSYTKINTMVNASTFTTYYDDVRVPDSAVVYGVNRGWDLIVNQLNYERVSLAPAGMFSRSYEDVLDYARATKLPDGRRVIDQEWVRVNLATGQGPPRRAHPPQLEGVRQRRGQPGRRQRHQGVRHRVLRRRLQAADGGAGAGRDVRPGFPRRPARRPAGPRLPGHADPHLRRRRQRGAARPRRPLRPGPAPGAAALSTTDGRTQTWTSRCPSSSRRSASWPPRSSPTPCRPRCSATSRPAATTWPSPPGRRWPGPTCVGLAVPEADGGAGLGVFDAGLVAEQVGRHVALVPYWPTVAAATTLARWAPADLKGRLLPAAIAGDGPLTVALWEPGTTGVSGRPAVTATPDGDGWRLDGVKQPVPWAGHAAAIVVPATVGEADVALFAVAPGTPGVTAVAEATISREPFHTVTFDGARVGADALVAAPGGRAKARSPTWPARRPRCCAPPPWA